MLGTPFSPRCQDNNDVHSQVNATHTIVTGGEIGNSISDVWFYNWEDQSWQRGPSMKTERRLHDCIGISNNRVMVTGGYGLSGEGLTSVEIYDPELKPGGDWYQVQDLPEADEYFKETTLKFNSQIFWIRKTHIWKFVSNNVSEYEWLMFANELDSSPNSPLTMLVPNDFFPSKQIENEENL